MKKLARAEGGALKFWALKESGLLLRAIYNNKNVPFRGKSQNETQTSFND